MSVTNREGPIIESGLCRCCGETKRCRVLNVEYEWQGQKEVYSDMFVDCFGLLLLFSHLDGEPIERAICATCVSRLREAAAFRRQVLSCEERLLKTRIHVQGDDVSHINVKEEIEEVKIELIEIDDTVLPPKEPSMLPPLVDVGNDDMGCDDAVYHINVKEEIVEVKTEIDTVLPPEEPSMLPTLVDDGNDDMGCDDDHTDDDAEHVKEEMLKYDDNDSNHNDTDNVNKEDHYIIPDPQPDTKKRKRLKALPMSLRNNRYRQELNMALEAVEYKELNIKQAAEKDNVPRKMSRSACKIRNINENRKTNEMGRSRAEYMRDYRQKKREEKLKTGNVEPKKIAHNSTQRSRDFRARTANSILSQTSTADPTTALPILVVSHATLRLPSLAFSSNPSTSTATSCNTGPAEIHPRPADVEQEREDVEQVEHVNNSTVRLVKDLKMGKSKAEYMRDYRQKKRVEQVGHVLNCSTARLIKNAKISKSKAEYMRDYRRKKRVEQVGHVVNNSTVRQYHDYQKFSIAHDEFKTKFLDNNFGAVCDVCDRLWYENNMKSLPPRARELISAEFQDLNIETACVCNTCHLALSKNKIPTLSKSNGFKYPSRPHHLPELDLISERLISPRLPFMAIRRLRHGNGQYRIMGQVINVPVSVDNTVTTLPRDLDDDYAINVHIKRKEIHKSSYLMGYIKNRVVKTWLEYLINQELFKFYGISIDESLFNAEYPPTDQIDRDEFSEVIEIAECLTAQQQTLLWDENTYLCLAPGDKCILFDEHCEELAFPSIYLGQFRTFKEEIKVTPFMIATSELRRADRRGVTPTHLLYMAMKILRLRTRDTLKVAFKFIGKDSTFTRAQLESTDYINNCIDNNLSFLSHIPNSAFYWAARKKDLFAMIRQLGKPTFFLTMSANEIGWVNLMKLLYKLKNDGAEIDDDTLHSLHYNSKATLINEDPVTCAIHFNKLVDTIMGILQSKRHSPFERHYVTHFFKRIEFHHRCSPHAHILLWLNNAPEDAVNGDQSVAINLIDSLVFVSKENASGHEKLQEHKHTFTCYEKIGSAANQKCRFGAPFMPSRSTVILIPMPADDPRRNNLANVYNRLWKALEENDYRDIDHFFQENNIFSDEFYLDVLRAGIKRPMVFLKRKTTEKWINAFNPFILNVLSANMDFQFIIEEYSCAAYVVEYVNKTNRGISNLQRKIIEVMDKHPVFDIVENTRKLSIDMLNAVEMSSQEAAWFLLRLPISSSSVKVIYIATVWPIERQQVRKTLEQLNAEEIDDDSTDVWQNNCFEKYERRPVELEDLTLAQATAYYYTVTNNEWKRRRAGPRIIRYRNYDKAAELEEYKREMVTLYLPFRNEETEILAERKYIQLYDDNEIIIMQARKKFESNVDIAKTMEICRQMSFDNEENDQDDVENLAARVPAQDPLADFHAAANTEMNADMQTALLSRLGPVRQET